MVIIVCMFFACLAAVVCPACADTTVMIAANNKSLAPATLDWTVTVPPFSVEHQVRLSMEARIDAPRLAGSNPWIVVVVNGNTVTRPDLLNKRNEFKLQNGLDLTWYREGRWRVLYSPDFEAAVKDTKDPYACPQDDPYHYVWDVTRYVHPGENKLQIRHLKILAKPSTLFLRNVEIEVGKPISPPPPPAVAPAPTGRLPTFVATGAQTVPMQVRLSPSGRIQLTVSGRDFTVETRTSLPDGKWLETPATGAAHPIVTGSSGTAQWQSQSYRIERSVTVAADHIHVADTITNTTDKLIGVIVEDQLHFTGKPEELRVAGREGVAAVTRARNGCNPTTFARWSDLALGLVAVDDVFRVHNLSVAEPGILGLSDDQLGIDAGKSVTLEWSIYPVPHGDYWDFVNAVRRNWGANFTIPGPFSFVSAFPADKPEKWYGDWAHERDLKIVCGGIAKYPDGKYAHGTGILDAPQWVAHEREWTRKMLAAAPGVKVLAYFHAQCCTEPGAAEKYKDSYLIDAKGEHLDYPYRYPLPLYLPTENNSYGKALWKFVHVLLDDIGTSGIYWDEMTHSVLEYAYKAPWDGHTVTIDPTTHAVLGKGTSVPLIMQPLDLAIVHYLREHGKFLMANTQPMTRTMLNEKIVRFVETGTYAYLSNTNLGCPLGLGNHDQELTQADSARHVRRILEEGALYYGHTYDRAPGPWNFTSVMFPITPVELHAGFVLGKERIETARSGRFGWPDGAAADVYVVDANGNRVAHPDVKDVGTNGRHLYEIRMPGDQFAILVKLQ